MTARSARVAAVPAMAIHRTNVQTLAFAVLTFVAYVISARAGLSVAYIHGNVTSVWPPSGIALAALALGGLRLLPAITLGSFVANSLSGAPPTAAALIALGNSAEALLGWFTLTRVARVDLSLRRIRDALGFLFATPLPAILAAVVGTFGLRVTGLLPADRHVLAAVYWFLGDLLGMLVVAPVIFTFARTPRERPTRSDVLHAVGLGVTLAAIASAIFLQQQALAWFIYPVAGWAALRFGPRGASLCSLAIATLAVIFTAQGMGPFATSQLHPDLAVLQTFVGVAAMSSLVFAAAVAQVRAGEREAVRLEAERLLQEQRQRDAAKQAEFERQLIGIVSHDLRGPLQAISLAAELLERHGGEAARPHVERVRDATDRAQRLIRDLLDFTQVRLAGQLPVKPTHVEAHTLAMAAIEHARAAFPGRMLNVDCDPDLAGSWDPDRLGQLLQNLISNALTHGDPAQPVTLRCLAEGDRATLLVHNDGDPIPAELLPDRLFEPMQRGTGARPSGIGLGLYIVRKIAEAHGGTVEVTSSARAGTTFKVSIPRER